MNSDIIAMQQSLFSRLAKSIPTDWRRIVMSYEQEQSPDGLKQSLVLF